MPKVLRGSRQLRDQPGRSAAVLDEMSKEVRSEDGELEVLHAGMQ